jgi:O-antigen ligase
MPQSPFSSFADAKFRFSIMVLFLVLCTLGGGASRPDTLSLLYLRPAAVIALAALLLSPGTWNFAGLKPAFVVLGAMVALTLIQLVPIPPDLWLSLPGRERFGEAAAAAGIAQPWRPLSLTPDLTINSLLALLPPLVVLIGMASLGTADRQRLVPVLIAVVVAAMFMGILQVASGGRGAAYLYRVTHEASAVGLFANRNHQATLLAMGFPLLRVWYLIGSRDPEQRRLRGWIGGVIGALLIPMLLVTGSRTGMAIGLLGLGSTLLIAPVRMPEGWSSRTRALVRAALVVAPLAIGALVVMLGRATAIQRLFSNSIGEDARVLLTPTSWQIAKDFFPFGTGLGSFDTVFRIFEPDWSLERTYFNHAHNDFLEMLITGGLPAVLLIAGVLIWFALRSMALWRAGGGAMQRGAAVMLLFVVLASVVDYPLRTPLMSAVVAMVVVWFLDRVPATGSGRGGSGTAAGK